MINLLKLFFLLVVTIQSGCKNGTKPPDPKMEATGEKEMILVDESPKRGLETNTCIKCDSIYKVFPNDSNAFERNYGYPDGSRYYYAQEDCREYFFCLDHCFDFQKLRNAVNISLKIKFEADGPTHLQHFLTEYLMKNHNKAIELYSKLSCEEYINHLEFSFKGIPLNDTFFPELCAYFNDLKIQQECKVLALKKYCK